VIRRVLHISNSSYGSLEDAGPSRAIYDELASGADAYHVLARGKSIRPAVELAGRVHLHLLPRSSSKAFPLLAYAAVPLGRRYGCQAIVAQDPLLGGLAGVHAGRALGLPTLVECHTDAFFHMASGSTAERAGARCAFAALRGATRVRAGTRGLARKMREAGVRPERIVLVPYRVDLRQFDPRRVNRSEVAGRLGLGGKAVVTVGRFVEQKGYVGLIRAFGRVVERVPHAQLVIAGGGPLRGCYEAEVERLGLRDAVTLFDWVSREQQVGLLAVAEVYVQPSVPGHGEWMPRTILEAMAMRLPVVASEMAGIPDVVEDARSGELVPPGNEDALAGALAGLLDDPARRRRLGDEGRRLVEEVYGWDVSFERYREAIYTLPAPRA